MRSIDIDDIADAEQLAPNATRAEINALALTISYLRRPAADGTSTVEVEALCAELDRQLNNADSAAAF